MALITPPRFAHIDRHTGPHSTPVGYCTLLTEDGTPARRRVRLHDQFTGAPIREIWSNPVTGAWQFTAIRAGLYYALVLDHTGDYNGEIVTDIVVPTP